MKYIETESCKPAINLAYEEYFLKGKDLEENILMLWRNEPVIVVGRFQNTLEEINSSFAEAHNIQVIRRISGGGAVYHDLGNLCFSFILHDVRPEIIDKSKYICPLVEALRQLGVQVEITRRNDLTVAGKKISGNAMALHKNRLLFHGTLLFDADLEILDESLRETMSKITSKGVKSVRSIVTNLREYLSTEMDTLQFKQSLKQLLFSVTPTTQYVPDQEDFNSIQKLVRTKYETWEWNFGNNPSSTIQRSFPLPYGAIEIQLELEKGFIKDCQIKGELNMLIKPGEIEKQLRGVRYTLRDIQRALREPPYTVSSLISIDDLVHWIIS